MPTAASILTSLSSLASPSTASDHFKSIQSGSGGQSTIIESVDLTIDSNLEVTMSANPDVSIDTDDLEIDTSPDLVIEIEVSS
jgi:hypothetical protein